MRDILNRTLAEVARRKDLFFLAFIFMFVLMFILPVPAWMIDGLIAINIALTLLVLVAATYLRRPTELTTFPAIILFSTVFRLAITVASSRLILSEATAGDVIRSFGSFVVSGKLIVGLTIFLIVAIVQFIVVVKGVERIAEVSARFTLDSIHGRQMSIDTDLRNGDITKEEARRRRTVLGEENQFFGAMDGAMRFVKGDAIAGFVVIFVNLIGGILVGMLTRGMGFSEAARTYSLLTVGEGLVSQIPAMLVAIAAGMVATRVAREDSTDLGSDIAGELVANRKSLMIAGVVLALIGFLPGFPTWLFLLIAALLITTAFLLSPEWMFWRKAPTVETGEDQPAADTDAAPVPPAPPMPAWPRAAAGDLVQLVMTSALAEASEQQGLPARHAERCAALSATLGFPVPRATVRIDETLALDAYRLEIEDVPVLAGHWRAGIATIRASRGEAERFGPGTSVLDHPLLGEVVELPLAAIPPSVSPQRLLDAPARLLAEIDSALNTHAAALFGFGEATAWLAQQNARHPQLVAQIQQTVPTLRLVELCRRLLEEGVGLAPPRTLLEAIARASDAKLDVTQTVEMIRKLMRRQIVHAAARGAAALPALVLDPNAENRLTALARVTPADIETLRGGNDLSGLTFARAINTAASQARDPATHPVLVTSSRVRAIAQSLLKRHGVTIPVISLEEIGTEMQIRPLRALTPAELGLA